jgi:enoyl-CoA hydratase/carnithine racemase
MTKGDMVDITRSPNTKVTVERRGQIVLIGINRPQMFNHIDPETFYGLAKAYYDFDSDPTLRAAVLFRHGENFSRGNDVDAEYVKLLGSEDFLAGRKAEAEHRPPIFHGR